MERVNLDTISFFVNFAALAAVESDQMKLDQISTKRAHHLTINGMDLVLISSYEVNINPHSGP